MTVWRTLLMAGVLSGALAACAPQDNQGGGGGGSQTVESDRLPDSNNVNPSIEPDSYIDEEAEKREEGETSR